MRREIGTKVGPPHDASTIKRYKRLRDWEAEEKLRKIAGEQDETSTNDGSGEV